GYNGTFTVKSVPTPTTFTYTVGTTGFANTGGAVANITTATSALAAGVVTVTVTTGAAHGFVPGQTITISGVTDPRYNGLFQVLAAPSAPTFTYAFNAAAAPTTPVSGGTASAATIASGASEVGNTVTITTTTAHDFVPGQTVVISGVPVSSYNGTFTIS